MAIEISWHDPDEKTIMVQTYNGRWSVEDYIHVVDEGAGLINALPHTVHVILDFTASRGSPANLMTCGQYANKRLPRNQGIVVFVQSGPIIQAFMQVARSLNMAVTRHLHNAETLDEAIAIIERERENLLD